MNLEDFGTANPKEDTKTHWATGEVASSQSVLSPTSLVSGLVGKHSQWSVVADGIFASVGETADCLPPGLYVVKPTQSGWFFSRQVANTDDLIRFPDSIGDLVLAEVASFWENRSKFTKYGFLQRRGYLFYGPQGSGKSCTIQLLIADIIKRNGLVFICEHPEILSQGLHHFRSIEPDRPVLCLFEDVDSIIQSCGEASLLSFLDGEHQIDRCISLATTNFPELLPKRIVNRPRRFDRILKVGMPSDEHRRIFFQSKLLIDPSAVEKWVDSTKLFSFAACAELVISVECLGNPFDVVLKQLRELLEAKPSSGEFDSRLGFGN